MRFWSSLSVGMGDTPGGLTKLYGFGMRHRWPATDVFPRVSKNFFYRKRTCTRTLQSSAADGGWGTKTLGLLVARTGRPIPTQRRDIA
jgi:hypothetical protein